MTTMRSRVTRLQGTERVQLTCGEAARLQAQVQEVVAERDVEDEAVVEEIFTPVRKRRRRNMERSTQRNAVQELLTMRAANGGKKQKRRH